MKAFDKKLLIALTLILHLAAGCTGPNNHQANHRFWTEDERAFLISELENTRARVLDEVESLNNDQWYFKADSATWPIAYIIEHLSLQDVMHYREVYLISKSPAMPELISQTMGHDSLVMAYATDPVKGIADWFVTPLGRWCDKAAALGQFDRARDQLIDFVSNTKADLRVQFTFRDIPDSRDFRKIRDLHQIILTTIAHTKRHLAQIERIKSHPGYPN